MNRIILTMPVFFAALVFGYTLVPEVASVLVNEGPNPEIIKMAESLQPETVPLTASDQYTSEFSGLPNFEELEYAETPAELIEMLESEATFRKSEMIAKTGESWLGLFEQNGKYELKKAKATVKQLSSVSYAGDENDAKLTFDKVGIAVLALRNISSLKPGKVTTVYHRPSWEEITRRNLDIREMEDGYMREFNLNDSWYTLRVANGRTKDGTKAAVLVLEHDNSYQILKQIYRSPQDERSIIGSLLWVGDLDNDGKLDLYFDEFNEKGYSAVELHLSSKAESDKLVNLSAAFSWGGC